MSRRKYIRLTVSLATIAILTALGYNVTQTGTVDIPTRTEPTPAGYYRVVNVADGDTVTVRVAGKPETVRLIGIDTPEEKDPRKPVQCFAQAAANNMQRMVGHAAIRLETDPANSNRDKYHRLLRYVYLQDGTLVNAEQIKQGYAFAYTLFPFTKLDEFRAYEHEARASGRGLWSGCQIHTEGEKEQTNNL